MASQVIQPFLEHMDILPLNASGAYCTHGDFKKSVENMYGFQNFHIKIDIF